MRHVIAFDINNKQLNAYADIAIRSFQSGKTFLKIKLINVEINIYENYFS